MKYYYIIILRFDKETRLYAHRGTEASARKRAQALKNRFRSIYDTKVYADMFRAESLKSIHIDS